MMDLDNCSVGEGLEDVTNSEGGTAASAILRLLKSKYTVGAVIAAVVLICSVSFVLTQDLLRVRASKLTTNTSSTSLSASKDDGSSAAEERAAQMPRRSNGRLPIADAGGHSYLIEYTPTAEELARNKPLRRDDSRPRPERAKPELRLRHEPTAETASEPKANQALWD